MKGTAKYVDEELVLMKLWFDNEELLSSYFTNKHNFRISTSDISDALFMSLSDNSEAQRRNYWNLDMQFDNVVQLLSDFDFKVLNKEVVTKIILPDELLMEYKVLVKSKGLVWKINKYDKDAFPSNPHAHQLDNNIKLDLSNGNCYQVRKYIYKIKKKDLLDIRNKVEKVYDGELPILAV